MEELRSTEALDKEIVADARKKAEKILATADRESEQILADVSKRLKKSEEERRKFYEVKTEQFKINGDSSLPLEKERFLVSFVEKSVSDSIDSYLKSLSKEKRFELIKGLFGKSKKLLEGKKVNATIYGVELKLAENFLKSEFDSNLNTISETSFEQLKNLETAGISIHEGIILETEDKSIKCRLSLEQLILELKENKYKELAKTLFCGRIPE